MCYLNNALLIIDVFICLIFCVTEVENNNSKGNGCSKPVIIYDLKYQLHKHWPGFLLLCSVLNKNAFMELPRFAPTPIANQVHKNQVAEFFSSFYSQNSVPSFLLILVTLFSDNCPSCPFLYLFPHQNLSSHSLDLLDQKILMCKALCNY